MAIFFNFSPTSTHLHPLQVENCDSNSRLVVDENDNGKRVKINESRIHSAYSPNKAMSTSIQKKQEVEM